MADGAEERTGGSNWSELLAQTRRALATLRAEDIEKLARRAEEMLDVVGLRLGELGRVELAREHRLLGDLLLATDRNRAVLQRLRGGACERKSAGKMSSRWAR